MKKITLTFLILFPALSFCQLGISFHQSNLPFIGINYEIKDRIRPELRIGTDNYFSDISVEGVITYDMIQKNDYEFYAGIGARVNSLAGIVIPIGLNIFPFTEKQFGFHIELSPIIGDDSVIRGSWGIRYRFRK